MNLDSWITGNYGEDHPDNEPRRCPYCEEDLTDCEDDECPRCGKELDDE